MRSEEQNGNSEPGIAGRSLDTLDGGADLREELDLDSMDFLNVLIAIEKATGVSVPERDYPQVRTLDALVEYVCGAAEHARDR